TPLEALPSTAFRPRLMAAVDSACEHGARLQRDRAEGQSSLFGGFGSGGAADDGHAGQATAGLPDARAWTETEQLAFEKETLGLYWSGHPVDRYASALKTLGARSIGELADAPVGAPRADAWPPGGPKPIEADTSIGGIVAACRPLKTRKGDRMAVFTLEDSQGSVEVIAFPEAYQRAGSLLETGTMVLVSGKLERDDESVRILASDIVGIDAVHE